MLQIRNVQRTDWRLGGEVSRNSSSGKTAVWTGECKTAAGRTAAMSTAEAGASYFEAGTGAWIQQHEVFEGAAKWKFSPADAIFSQRDCVCGAEHSAELADMSAQADRGTGPRPSRLRTTMMAKARGMSIQGV